MLGGEARGDGSVRVTRRVELPSATAPGELSYTVTGELRGSAKEKLAIGVAPPLVGDTVYLPMPDDGP